MTDILTTPRMAVRPPRLRLRLGIVILGLALLGGALFGFQQFKAHILKGVTANIRSAVPVVGTAKAGLQEWQPSVSAVGSLRASEGADLAAEIGGVVEEIRFESGQIVPAGAVLLKLRPNDDEAKLQQLQATADLDATIYARDVKQLAIKGIAQSTVDTDAGTLKVARAQVAAQQAIMAEKTIKAPFAGRLGVRQVDVGQYLAPGTAVVTLQALDPMFLDFHLPQQALGQIAVGQTVTVTVDSYPDRKFTGTIASLDAKVDIASRMIQVRAKLANPDGALLPGMYASLEVAAGAAQSLVTVPAVAVSYNPYGSLVYVVETEKDANGLVRQVVHQHFVTTGATRGDQVSILKGVSAGDEIVTAGQLKLHDKSPVQIDNAVTLPNDPAPVPQDH
jgi:membrane fusion protein (multidrug efflux system)